MVSLWQLCHGSFNWDGENRENSNFKDKRIHLVQDFLNLLSLQDMLWNIRKVAINQAKKSGDGVLDIKTIFLV